MPQNVHNVQNFTLYNKNVKLGYDFVNQIQCVLHRTSEFMLKCVYFEYSKMQEPWLIGLLASHIIVLIATIKTRKNNNVQTAIFFAACTYSQYATLRFKLLGLIIKHDI